MGLELLGVLMQVDARAVEARRAREAIDEKYMVVRSNRLSRD